jgi:spermidine synthase
MKRYLAGVALISSTLLMTELALTRIFSVIMYYHFAFLAISIALFGLSASGVCAFAFRRTLDRVDTDKLLAAESLIYALSTLVALFFLVRLRIGLTYSPRNLILMLTIYALAALPFFTGGMVVTLAISRLSAHVNAVYASDLIGAAAGCLVLIPLLDRVGAPGVVLMAAALALTSAILFSPLAQRTRIATAGVVVMGIAVAGQLSGAVTFDIGDAKGHVGDHALFTKWNSFSRIGVYERTHDNWSLSQSYSGPVPRTRYMDIDAAASTPILELAPDLSNAQFLRYELTAVAYRLKQPGFCALVIGPGGGRDLVSALVFGAARVDGVEVNPIIADDVMRGQFKEFSGGIYAHPRVHVVVDDGRSFVRGATDRYDIIQASLVDTWAATAAGAYTLTENTLYTVEAFNDYIDHLTDDGVLTMTRWVMDGLRLVSLAQDAGEARGWNVAQHLAIVQSDRVQTFMLKKSEFTPQEVATLRAAAHDLQFNVIYAPTFAGEATPALPLDWIDGMATADYARLIRAADRHEFYASYKQDIRPTTDDRPFFFHTTKLQDQFQVAFGREMLFGNGLSALMTLIGISGALVALFVIGPLVLTGGPDVDGWFAWLLYFGALGAGFMLIEVSVLQRFVLLLGHPVYSLTVTLFSLLLGTGIGAAWSRRLREETLARSVMITLVAIALLGLVITAVITPLVTWAIPFSRATRIAIAVATLVPIGVVLGVPMPAGIRLLSARAPQMLTWAWGINGALSVVGATLAIFVAMNWGFAVTLAVASGTYVVGLMALLATMREAGSVDLAVKGAPSP